MNDPRDIVAAKRDGGSLPPADVRAFVKGYTAGDVSDALAAAFLMACLLRGLDVGGLLGDREAVVGGVLAEELLLGRDREALTLLLARGDGEACCASP